MNKKIWWTVWLVGLLPTFFVGVFLYWILVGVVVAGLILLWD
jgi:hypothetical protein